MSALPHTHGLKQGNDVFDRAQSPLWPDPRAEAALFGTRTYNDVWCQGCVPAELVSSGAHRCGDAFAPLSGQRAGLDLSGAHNSDDVFALR